MPKQILSLIAMGLLMAALLPWAPGVVAVAAESTITLMPEADTYTDSAYPTANFGTRATLRVDGSPSVRSYLRFNLSQVTGPITQARLRVYANTASSSGISVFSVSSTTWGETSMTYSSAPAVGGLIAISSPVSAGTWKELDVTGVIQPAGRTSFALGTSGSTAISLASREVGANAPQLIISTAAQPTFQPSATATLPGPIQTVTPTLQPSPQPTSSTSSITLYPKADTYADSAYLTSNYGTRTNLRVDGSPNVRSYLLFDLSGAAGSINRARLRIFANSASTSGISAAPVSSTSWGETTLNYTNSPAVGEVIATSNAVAAGTWKELDVTGLVQSNGLLSLALGTPGATAISLASRESGANSPQLILDMSASWQTALLLAAGDIAKCSGGTPSPTNSAKITADMLLTAPGMIFSLGDNSNDTGSPADYTNCFNPTWGRLKDRLNPVMGNHDQIFDPQGGPYFSYFGSAAHPESFGHYSLDLGGWHIVVLNAECAVGNQGCGSGSIQEKWLRADLAAHAQKCTLAIWHQPLFTSGTQSPTSGMTAFWQALWDYHADVILNGHDHNYERFAPQNPFGNPDPVNGIREFVVGTGGASLDPSSLPWAANQEVRSAQAYGYLKLTLKPDSYDWQFIAQPGSSFTDSGTTTCH